MPLKFDDNITEAENDKWFWERVTEAIVSYPTLSMSTIAFVGRTMIMDTKVKIREHVAPQSLFTRPLCSGWQIPLTIVDVGANVGAFTWLAAMMGEDVHAYEPAQETFNRLQHNIKNHSQKAENVTFFRNAVSAKSGETVYLSKSSSSGLSGDAFTSHVNGKNSEEVTTVSLEDIIARTPRKKIDYLKVDCEGAEYDFLLNKDLSKVGYISLELHGDADKDKENLIEHIELTHRLHSAGDSIFATNNAMINSYGLLAFDNGDQYFGTRLSFETQGPNNASSPLEGKWVLTDKQIFNQLNPFVGKIITEPSPTTENKTEE